MPLFPWAFVPTTKVLFILLPSFLLPPLSSCFSSIPPLAVLFPPLVLSSIPILLRSGPRHNYGVLEERCKVPNGVWGKAPAGINFGLFREGKDSFDSIYNMDFCIEKIKFISITIGLLLC